MSDSRWTSPGGDPAVPQWEEAARQAASAYRVSVAESDSAMPRELLVFRLAGSAYAIAVERVREIVRLRDLTRVPRAPAWLLGVVALRGEIVEVVDLRRRLALPASDPVRSSRVIVLHGEEDRVTGVLVDSVHEVHRVPEEELLPAQGFEVASVSHICRRGEEFVSILEVDRVLETQDG
jgi:purine-binding chemotaxis protein CheW